MSFPPDQDSRPTTLPASRSVLPFILSGVMILIYFGFILLVAFYKPLLAQTVVPGLSWGILLGALVIVSAWLLTLVYVMSFNKTKGGN